MSKLNYVNSNLSTPDLTKSIKMKMDSPNLHILFILTYLHLTFWWPQYLGWHSLKSLIKVWFVEVLRKVGFAGHLGGDFLVFLLVFSPMILLCVESEVVAKARSSSSREASRGGVLSGVEDLPSFLGILQSWTISCCFPLTMCVLKSLKSKRNFSLKIVTTFPKGWSSEARPDSITPQKVRLG